MQDTIAAIATGLTDSGIGIIRISGEKAIETANKIFKPKNPSKSLTKMDSFHACFGHITYDDKTYDEAIALLMRAPHSYTTEDVVELDCHGGITVLKSVFELLVSLGVRPADPGEFTKRAFLGGRLDLSQAESVMDLIHAKNKDAASASLRQLSGAFSNTLSSMRDQLLHETAYIESALDDPENYSLEDYPQSLSNVVDNLLTTVDRLLSTGSDGRLLKEGIRTIIIGRPNVGKSSVLNMLMGEERAIVTEVAGTTRDTLEEWINIGGISLNLVDTAGIRATDDIVERIGVEKALSTINEANLVLYIVDGSEPLSEHDLTLMERLKGKKVITLINKNDRKIVVDKLLISEKIDTEIIEISALMGTGSEELAAAIRRMFFSGSINTNDQIYITNARHLSLLTETKNALSRVKDSIDAGMGEDFFTIDLMDAYTALGKILGKEVEDDLVNKIFSEFCMGK